MKRNRKMSNPAVLITGALTGIGRAAAVAFAKKGGKLAVAGRRDEVGKELVKELRSLGSEALKPTSTRKLTSAPWLTRPSHGLAVLTSR
jgi:NAD(P)-dependent dehydrogenase (short-subunit alcohol dehydrogenase family)